MFERWLRRVFLFKEIGWAEIGETFTRFTILKTPWFRVYLHKLDAPNLHPDCHNHPWHFWTLILKGGYREYTDRYTKWRRPFTILYRSALFTHNVITPQGTAWSIILASKRIRDWQFTTCGKL